MASVYDLKEKFINDCNHYCRASPHDSSKPPDLSELKRFSLKRYTTNSGRENWERTVIENYGTASVYQQGILDSEFFVQQEKEITALDRVIRNQIEDIEALAKRIHSQQNVVDQLRWSIFDCTYDYTHNALSKELQQLKDQLTKAIDQTLKDHFDKLCAAVSAEQLLFVLEMLNMLGNAAAADKVHIWLDLGGDVLKALFYESESIKQHACLDIYTSSSIIYEGLCKFACAGI